MILDDLCRYNEAGCRTGSWAFWRHIARQTYTHPGLLAVVIFRFGGWVGRCRAPIVRQLLEVVYQCGYAFARLALQIEVPRGTRIGPGFRIDHYGGILINSQAVIGRNFTVSQGVLVGATESGVPTIGDDVHCGVGAKILGGITLGDCIKIGAGAVVTRSFEGHAVIAGVPARVLRPLHTPPGIRGEIPRSTADNRADCDG
jgi:serine O-acetyltransferase